MTSLSTRGPTAWLKGWGVPNLDGWDSGPDCSPCCLWILEPQFPHLHKRLLHKMADLHPGRLWGSTQ